MSQTDLVIKIFFYDKQHMIFASAKNNTELTDLGIGFPMANKTAT